MPAEAVPSDSAPLPAGKSLRAKALLAILALLTYLFGSVVYVSIERAKIDASFQALQLLSRHDKALALTEAAVNGAVIDVSEASSAGQGEPRLPGEIVLYMEACAKLFAALDEFDPGYALLQRAIARSYDTLKAAPVRANWIDLRESLARAAADLEIRRRTLADRRDALTSRYQRQYDAVTIESLLLALVGFAVFGSMVAWFFARLSNDIHALELHARHIVRGSRGVALAVRRDDELGRLMHAVNHMSADLDEREKQIELDGQRRSHQDKMLAVGALAAGFAHEVNNPLAVISGVAQELSSNAVGVDAAALGESARLIQAQVQRASQAARQLAEAAAPHARSLDWVDLNAVVRRVVQLMGYDRRYRQIPLRIDMDPALPAVRVSADAVQQVLMQVLSLGFDALAAQAGQSSAGNPAAQAGTEQAAVATHRAGDRVEITLSFPARIDYNRAEVQRGLLLSRAVIEPLRGQLALAQDEAPRLRIKLTLPVDGGGLEG